jgi:hypothetical protein
MSFGVMGDFQPQDIQILMNMIDFGMNLKLEILLDLSI